MDRRVRPGDDGKPWVNVTGTRPKAALRPGGTAAVVDFIADEGRRDDTTALLFGIVMMTWTPRGSVFTASEYRELFQRAGFKQIFVRRSPQSAQALLLAR